MMQKILKYRGAAHVELAIVVLLLVIILGAVITQVIEMQRQDDEEGATFAAMQQILHAHQDTEALAQLTQAGSNEWVDATTQLQPALDGIAAAVNSFANVPGLQVTAEAIEAQRPTALDDPLYTSILTGIVGSDVLDITAAATQESIENQVPIAIAPEHTKIIAVAAGANAAEAQILATTVGVQTVIPGPAPSPTDDPKN